MSRRSRILRLALAGVAACMLLAVVQARSWPRQDPAHRSAPDLVIALSSGVFPDSALDEPGRGRLVSAVALTEQRRSPRLITTRVVNARSGATSDPGQRAVIAASRYGGLWTALTPIVHSTRDEALALRAAVKGPAAIVVVTSRMHTRRACATFERVGFIVECVNGYSDPRWWRVPYDYVYERAATAKYRREGWIR